MCEDTVDQIPICNQLNAIFSKSKKKHFYDWFISLFSLLQEKMQPQLQLLDVNTISNKWWM